VLLFLELRPWCCTDGAYFTTEKQMRLYMKNGKINYERVWWREK
jgi:hypothetical protein